MKWLDSTLGELIKEDGGVIQTGPFGSQLHQRDYQPEGIPVIMPKDIADGRIAAESVARVSEETAHRLARHKLKARSIVLPRRGDITKRAFIRPEQQGWLCGTGCLKIEFVGNRIVPEFFYYFMDQAYVAKWLEQHAVGTTMLNLSAGIVAQLPVRYPAIRLQRKIACILYAYDDLIENNRRRMALSEKAARLLYDEWFVRLRFPGHEGAGIANSPLGRIPSTWEVTELGDITTKIGSGATPRGGEASYETEGTVLIRSQNVYNDRFEGDGLAHINDDQADELAGVSVESGDILLNITGASVARCCMVPRRHLPARVNQHVMILRVDPALADPYFVLSAINSEGRKRQLLSYAQTGGTREALTKDRLANFQIVIPERSLLRDFGRIAGEIHQQLDVLAEQNVALRNARGMLLPRLMNGQIAV
jgi:type I restriction enzyme, S subunit